MISPLEADTALRSLALSAPRIAAAFLILPLLSKDDAPGLVRNTVYVALAIAVTPFLTETARLPREFVPWIGIIVKEIFIGATIGFAFSTVLWAVSMTGDIIDTKVGTNMASVVDPLGGHSASLSGALLSRFANYLFLALVVLEWKKRAYPTAGDPPVADAGAAQTLPQARLPVLAAPPPQRIPLNLPRKP